MSSSGRVGSLDSSIAHKEGCNEEFGELKNTMMKFFNELADEFRTTFDAIKGETAEMNTRMSVTIRAVESLTLGQTHVGPNKQKSQISEPLKGTKMRKSWRTLYLM